MSEFTERILQYWNAAYPILAIQSHEEDRITVELEGLCHGGADEKIPYYEWSMSMGYYEGVKLPLTDASSALKKILEFDKRAIVVMKDFNNFFGNQAMIRAIRDMIHHLEEFGKMIIVVNPAIAVPVELEKVVTFVEYALPRREDLDRILTKIIADTESTSDTKIVVKDRQALLEAIKGTTEAEAKNMLAFTVVKHGDYDDAAIRTILNEKAGVLKRSNLVTYVQTEISLAMLGGFGNVKAYAEQIAPVFWDPEAAEKYGLLPEDYPRSVLFGGLPGCGKSHACKAFANFLKIGLCKTDFGQLFGSKVGQSEQNTIRRNQLIESMAPVFDWWDEAEKGVGGWSGAPRRIPGKRGRGRPCSPGWKSIGVRSSLGRR